MNYQSIEVYGNPIAFETLSVDGAVGFTVAKYKNISTGGAGFIDAKAVLVTVDGEAATNDIRWTVDGTTPEASTTGHLLPAGCSLFIRGYNNIRKFKAIKEGTATTIQCTFFG